MSIFEEVGNIVRRQPTHRCPGVGCGRVGIGKTAKLCWKCEDAAPAKVLKYPRVCQECRKDFSSKRRRKYCIGCRRHLRREQSRDHANRAYAKLKREGKLASRFEYQYAWKKTPKGEIARQRGSAKVNARRRRQNAQRGLKKKPMTDEHRIKISAGARRRYAGGQ